jgi:hypothetical protein
VVDGAKVGVYGLGPTYRSSANLAFMVYL